VCPVIAKDEAAAKARIAELAKLANPEVALRVLADRLGHDLLSFALDEPVPDLPPSEMMQGHATVLASIAKRHNMTLRELRDYTSVSSGHRVVFGSPTDVANSLKEWHASGAADGFLVMSPYYPGPAQAFIDEVVPILVERGLFRRDYDGTTLRDHLGLARPASAYPAGPLSAR
jgi:alkanesulfonate monooxygenase SsuD/methylene tetrahydromethanopterin reductase-like flavin-dependent oxidoreductase (luciferase family)